MDNVNEIEQRVANLVKEMFDQKEETEIRKRTEEELNKAAQTVSDLTQELSNKNEEVSELENKTTELESKITELEKQLSDSEAEKATINSEFEVTKNEIEETKAKLKEKEEAYEDLQKDILADSRFEELSSIGVAGSDKEKLTAKIKDMSDEDFNSYKEELVSLRKAIIAELETKDNNDSASDDDSDGDEPDKDSASDNDDSDGDEPDKDSAAADDSDGDEPDNDKSDKDKGLSFGQAAQAALNLEFKGAEDVLAKYDELGKAMAESYKKS